VLFAALGLVAVVPGPAMAEETVREYAWHMAALKIAQAQSVSRGQGVVVAVIDSGVDATHPDLAGQVEAGKGFGADAAPDGRRDEDAREGHGTSMAGLIAGRGGGPDHVLGIAPKATIMPISTGVRPTVNEIADGIRWAVDHGAGVINISIGRPGNDVSVNEELSAIKYALDHNVVIVAAAGNSSQSGNGVAWPAKAPGVVAVAGLDRQLHAWSGSGHGNQVVLSAPAVQLISPAPTAVSRSGYVLSDGTSGASAIVSGAAALVRARYPALDVKNVVNRLVTTAKDFGQPGRDADYGFGMVQPAAALDADVSDVSQWPIATPSLPPSPSAGQRFFPQLVNLGGLPAAAVLVIGAAVLLTGSLGLRRRGAESVSAFVRQRLRRRQRRLVDDRTVLVPIRRDATYRPSVGRIAPGEDHVERRTELAPGVTRERFPAAVYRSASVVGSRGEGGGATVGAPEWVPK
jgi:type VII secretion-associated serine protease mycosin